MTTSVFSSSLLHRRMVMFILLILIVGVDVGEPTMGRTRQFGPYGHPTYSNNNNNNNYQHNNNHILSHPNTHHQYSSSQNNVKRSHNNPANYPLHLDNHNHHYHHPDTQGHHYRHYLSAAQEDRNRRDSIRRMFNKEKQERSFWDRLFGRDESQDLENDLTNLQKLSEKFGVYHLLPDDLKLTSYDIDRSSYTSYMGETQDTQDPKSFPGIDVYSLFAFALFTTSLTYSIHFLMQKEDDNGDRNNDDSTLNIFQGDLLRVVTDALERWDMKEE